MLTTRFTRLIGCNVPIQQAGMGGVATAELASAVALAGALGMIGGVRLGAKVLGEELDSLPRQTRSRIGVNFLVPFLDRESLEVAASRVRVVEFFFGEPDADLVERAHGAGALAAWQVGSVEEARAAAGAGCDFLVAQGIEAGGHVRGRIGLLPLLDGVLDAVNVPVLAAGGIATARAMAAALAAGADGVRVGTRFVAAAESAAHPAYQEALLRAEPEDTILTEAYSANWPNAPHRVLRGCIEAAQALTDDLVGGERPRRRHATLDALHDAAAYPLEHRQDRGHAPLRRAVGGCRAEDPAGGGHRPRARRRSGKAVARREGLIPIRH